MHYTILSRKKTDLERHRPLAIKLFPDYRMPTAASLHGTAYYFSLVLKNNKFKISIIIRFLTVRIMIWSIYESGQTQDRGLNCSQGESILLFEPFRALHQFFLRFG